MEKSYAAYNETASWFPSVKPSRRSGRPRPGAPRNRHAPGAAGLHRGRSGESVGRGQRSGPRSRLHGAAAGVVQPAPHQPRQSDSVQARQRPGGGNQLPYGNLPRLVLAWVSTEAVRTQSRELVLGRSLAEFMRKLGMEDRSGSPRGVWAQPLGLSPLLCGRACCGRMDRLIGRTYER